MKLKESIIGRLQEHQAGGEPPLKPAKRKPSEDKSSRPQLEETRVMNKRNGCIRGYSANTFHGLVRNYNEDRVSIILNITRPEALEKWPKCSYFAVFDGHGGSLCSDFLRDNMHKFIIEDKNFPFRPMDALKNGFLRAETEFKKVAESAQPVNRSGSCAIVVLIIDRNCFVANVGDSRAIMSMEHGRRTIALSNDHKPNCPSEKSRIESNGGSIYQSMITTKSGMSIPGPFRVSPGRLSVSRAIGDIQAKDEKYEGLPGVLISDPEITSFEIRPEQQDFVLLGCDGIFDKLENEEVSDAIWRTERQVSSEGQFLGAAVSAVLNESMRKKSMDNITAVLIMFDKEATFKNNIPTPMPVASTTPSPLEQRKSSLNLLKQDRNISSVALKQSKKEMPRMFEDLGKENFRKRQAESQSKQNTNTANIQPHQQSNRNNEKEDENSLMKLKKKSSVQISSKRLDLLQKTNELLGKKKMYEYIRY